MFNSMPLATDYLMPHSLAMFEPRISRPGSDVMAINPVSKPAGIPCIFWDHLLQYGDELAALKEMRTKAGLHSRSEIVINLAEADINMATIDDKYATNFRKCCTVSHKIYLSI